MNWTEKGGERGGDHNSFTIQKVVCIGLRYAGNEGLTCLGSEHEGGVNRFCTRTQSAAEARRGHSTRHSTTYERSGYLSRHLCYKKYRYKVDNKLNFVTAEEIWARRRYTQLQIQFDTLITLFSEFSMWNDVPYFEVRTTFTVACVVK